MGHLRLLANHQRYLFLNSNIVLESTSRSYIVKISDISDMRQLTFLMFLYRKLTTGFRSALKIFLKRKNVGICFVSDFDLNVFLFALRMKKSSTNIIFSSSKSEAWGNVCPKKGAIWTTNNNIFLVLIF